MRRYLHRQHTGDSCTFDNRLRKEIGLEPLPFTDSVSECVPTSPGVGIVEPMRRDFK